MGLRRARPATTTRCCSPPSTRAASASTTARSTPPSAPSARHDYALALPDAVPQRVRRRRRATRTSTMALLLRHRAAGVALRPPTSCRRRARSGLMQLMPGTARWVAKQLGRSRLPACADQRTSTSTRSSARTISSTGTTASTACRRSRPPRIMRDRAARRRGGRRTPLEGAIWVETIPFNETRDYVKKVLANAMIYAHALDRPYAPLTARLGTVAPRGANAASAGTGGRQSPRKRSNGRAASRPGAGRQRIRRPAPGRASRRRRASRHRRRRAGATRRGT